MTTTLTRDALDAVPVSRSAEHRLRARVAGEFREMPCLTLTLPQASRLFSIEPEQCERVLGALVQRGVLVRRGQVWKVQP